jgi:phenol 2-monooxygenase
VRATNVRYPFELTLHQGAIENTFLDAMSMRGLIVDRPTTVHDWQILSAAEAQDGYRIKVTLHHLMNAANTDEAQLNSNSTNFTMMNDENSERKETIIYTKYVIGCDGAHSWVRKKLGVTMDGEHTGKHLYYEFIHGISTIL